MATTRRRKKKQLSAFVIMPIHSKGSNDYNHYLSIYLDYIKPPFEENGITISRVDDISESGLINADIINLISKSDIVIGDLTDLNPNVFYELGIRHTIKKTGTILIMDEAKTKDIPFDLSHYRIIKFKSNASGLAEFKRTIDKYIKQYLNSTSPKKSDNPVHDILEKSLRITKQNINPENVNKSTTPSADNKENVATIDFTNKIIEDALDEAEESLVPKLIIERAEQAVRDEDLIYFLKCVQEFINLKTFLPSDREYLELFYLAKRIDARSKITKAILKLSREIFPESSRLITPYTSYLAHSTNSKDRQIAKEMVQNFLNIKVIKGKVEIQNISTLAKHTHLLSLMLDAYHRDGQHNEALEITSSLVSNFPDNTIALRNYARAMDKTGGYDQSQVLEEYRKAVIVPYPGDYSALWYAASLSEAGRLIDAVEAYLLACILDLDEPECFARLAIALSEVVQPRNLRKISNMEREIPSSINRHAVINCIILTIDCPSYGVEQKFSCESAMRNIGFGVSDLEEEMDKIGEMTRTDRRNFIEPLYEELKSRVTFEKED